MGIRFLRIALLLLAAALVVASLLSWPGSSPLAGAPLLEGAHVDASIQALLVRSCADCHSEATRYPWYSYVAPVSWLIRKDVRQGREHMDLSLWSRYSIVRRMRLLTGIANQVKEREMPLRQYTLLHRDARLSDNEIEAIFRWTQIERARLIEEFQRSK